MTQTLRYLPLLATSISVIALAACGGGGGDDVTPTPSTQFPLSTVVENIAKENSKFHVRFN